VAAGAAPAYGSPASTAERSEFGPWQVPRAVCSESETSAERVEPTAALAWSRDRAADAGQEEMGGKGFVRRIRQHELIPRYV
jgi:hypothetical protein